MSTQISPQTLYSLKSARGTKISLRSVQPDYLKRKIWQYTQTLTDKAMKTFGLILLIVGLLSTGLAAFEMITKKSSVDFDPLIATTHWTPLYKSTLAAILFLGSGVIVLIVTKENKITRNKYRSR